MEILLDIGFIDFFRVDIKFSDGEIYLVMIICDFGIWEWVVNLLVWLMILG